MKRSSAHSPDRIFLIALGSIIIYGLIILFDATVIHSNFVFGDAYQFFVLQIVWYVIGFMGFLFFYNIPYEKIEKLAYLFFLISLVLLLILAFFGLLRQAGVIPCNENMIFVPCTNGATRWFYVNSPPLPPIPFVGVIGFQPSEFAKFSMILYLAFQLTKAIKRKQDPVVVGLMISALFSFLIILQPNMSTSALIFSIGLIMLFVSGVSIKPFLVVLPVLISSAIFFIMSSGYRRERLMTFLNPDLTSGLEESYHIKQILIALGSGGIFGLGIGQSRQKFHFLPEIATDSIFAVLGEELGFIGTTVMVLLFALLIYRGFLIAERAPDLLSKLLVTGFISWIGLQFFINVAALTKLIPLTGIPIPLVSYGGSSTIFVLMGMGIIANISKYK